MAQRLTSTERPGLDTEDAIALTEMAKREIVGTGWIQWDVIA
jgi:hypothetical protein